MLQTNKQTKRKRAIRRRKNDASYPVEQCIENAAPYPLEQCMENAVSNESDTDTAEECESFILSREYPNLSKEVPGTSALLEQLNVYIRSVESEPTCAETEMHSSVPQPPARKKNKCHNNVEFSSNGDVLSRESSCVISNFTPNTTYAIVNGMPWHDNRPPHISHLQLKPVPGIVPLPDNKKAAHKKKDPQRNAANVLDIHTDEIIIDLLNENDVNQVCIICCEVISKASSYNEDTTIVKLKQCSHIFHKACLEAMYNSGPKDNSLQCPTCKKIHGVKCGVQPPGEMVYHVLPFSLPSFPECDTIRIIYNFSSGTQTAEHPRPGKKYTARGFPRHCYLPDNEMGRKVLRLLIKAWKRRLIFTIGRSSTTGEENTVTWNEIHHKTEFGCNRRGHGFPDPNYFDNVLAELEAHGVIDDEIHLWYPAS